MTIFGNDDKPKKKVFTALEDLYVDYSYVILIETDNYDYYATNLYCYMYLDDIDYAKACVWSVETKQEPYSTGTLLWSDNETEMPEGWGWKSLQLNYKLEPNTEYYVGFVYHSIYPAEDKLYHSKRGAQRIFKKGYNDYDAPEDLFNDLMADNNNGPSLIYIGADVYEVGHLLKINTITFIGNTGTVAALNGVNKSSIAKVSTIPV